MPADGKIILPARYYQDYFNYLISFIEEHSSHLLGQEEQDFIGAYRSLSTNAQCLFIRMLNRKGEFFRLDKLQYPEIEKYGESLDELCKLDFITLDDIHYPEIFRLFTKAELHAAFPELGINQMYKLEALEILDTAANEDMYLTISSDWQIIRVLKQVQADYLRFLFFGNSYGMMTEFVIRDVGNVKLENMEKHQFKPWFTSREESISAFELSNLSSILRLAMKELLPEEVHAITDTVDWTKYLRYSGSKKSADRLLLKIGEYFEKVEQPVWALPYYLLSQKHPARERTIRILERSGDLEQAHKIATSAAESPVNASELLFANDFLSKKSVRNYRTTTQRIKESPSISIVANPDIKVEQLACEYFELEGYQAIHAENYLWRGLFGLVYWEVIFDENQESFHHPLQRQPSDLFDENFYHRRKEQLLAIKKKLNSKKKLQAAVNKKHQEKEGIANPMVGWHESLLPSMEEAIKRLPLKGLINVLLEMAKNVKDNGAGFPDLFIWKDKEYHFYEIKSPNDHLSAQQLFWIDFMKRQGIKAEVLRLNYLVSD